MLYVLIIRSDDEETFCRALVEYTRACSHVGYPVREWRDSFPSCSKLLVQLNDTWKIEEYLKMLHPAVFCIFLRHRHKKDNI